MPKGLSTSIILGLRCPSWVRTGSAYGDSEFYNREQRSGTERVKADAREAQQLGANGVPFFVIDRQLAVGGAQPADALLQALRQAWSAQERA